MAGYGEGLGTGLPNDHDYNDAELRMLAFIRAGTDLLDGDPMPPAKIVVIKNPDAEPFFGRVFPWEVHCPEHGEVEAFIEHGMAMAEAWDHITTEHRQGVRCRWHEDKCQHGYWIDDVEVTTSTTGKTKRLCPMGKAVSA